MMDTLRDRMLFSVNGAAALTRAFKREALVSFQSDILAFVSLNHNGIIWNGQRAFEREMSY